MWIDIVLNRIEPPRWALSEQAAIVQQQIITIRLGWWSDDIKYLFHFIFPSSLFFNIRNISRQWENNCRMIYLNLPDRIRLSQVLFYNRKLLIHYSCCFIQITSLFSRSISFSLFILSVGGLICGACNFLSNSAKLRDCTRNQSIVYVCVLSAERIQTFLCRSLQRKRKRSNNGYNPATTKITNKKHTNWIRRRKRETKSMHKFKCLSTWNVYRFWMDPTACKLKLMIPSLGQESFNTTRKWNISLN